MQVGEENVVLPLDQDDETTFLTLETKTFSLLPTLDECSHEMKNSFGAYDAAIKQYVEAHPE